MLDEAGRPSTQATVERSLALLRAASLDEGARPLLVAGRLPDELEAAGFSLLAGLQLPKQSVRRSSSGRERDRAAERRKRLKEARTQARELRRAATAAEREARRLRDEAERAAEAAEQAEEQAAAAEAAVAELEGDH